MLRILRRCPSKPAMTDHAAAKRWFTQEVLPLERDLMRFIARHCRDQADVLDLRQEVYEKALTGSPVDGLRSTRNYVFTIARNVLIDRARRAKIVSFEQVADIDTMEWDVDVSAQDRHLTARDELRRAMLGLDQLPPRCREVVRLPISWWGVRAGLAAHPPPLRRRGPARHEYRSRYRAAGGAMARRA
jgi:RNA polymerase sigma factor (sigma-70 family)